MYHTKGAAQIAMSNSAINILITAGGTSEPIDNVRRIANTGTGRLGSLIADEFSANSSVDRIFYVCARDSVRPASEKVTCVEIQSVNDLEAAVTKIAGCCPIHAIIHSMAVIEGDRHHGYLLDADKNVRTFETKQEIARGIVQTVLSEVAKK